MKKKIIALCLALTTLATSGMVAFAAPSTVSSGASSNTSKLVYVKKPESLYDVTYESTYTISATAKSGTDVTVYKKGSDGKYHKIFNKGTVTVGASGLYSVTVSLSNGTNNFLVYAEGKAIEVQIVKVDITKKNSSGNKLSSGSSSASSVKPLA